MNSIARSLEHEAEAVCVLLANLRDVIGDDIDAIHDAIEGETSLLEAIGGAVDRLGELEAHEEALAAQMKALATRKERFSHQGDLIRAAILSAMATADLKKLELPQATLSRKPTPPKVLILDEASIPARFWKLSDPKLDRTSVLSALKANEPVPGAELSNGGETVAIKRS